MFLAVGTGAYEAAIFLMVAHAFFKALLFLGAGSVIHGLHDEQDLKRMGNLRRYMKLTFLTFGIGTLAIAGIPPLSGFFAKGEILDNAYARYPVLWAIGLVTAALTAYYMTRLVSLAFYGDDRWRQGAGAGSGHGGSAEPHESPWVMALPLVVLAVLAFFGGVLHLPWRHSGWNPLAWLGPVFGAAQYEAHQSTGTQWALAIVDSVVALVGLGVAFSLWSRRASRPELEPTALARAYYLDDIYDAVIARPGQAFARFCATVVEVGVIDGAVNGVGRLTRAAGGGLRRLQTGYVRQYALGIVLGAVLLLAWMISRAVS
jgi:NADH-quinone oxidoreductase subunit L